MRFYTGKLEGIQLLFAGFEKDPFLYRIEDYGMKFSDMTELVCTITDEQKDRLLNEREGKRAYTLDEIQILPPIVRPRQDVVCLGINYSEHAKEASAFSKEAFTKDKPYTIYFSKRVSEAAGDKETIPSYKGLVDSLDYEAELGVVLGRDAKGVKAEDAEKFIFGYTIINDFSARNLQTRHKQWYLGKSLDKLTSIGPCIVTKDEIGNVADLGIRSYVNGELRQNSNTGFMIQTIGGAVEELSEGMTLLAGTLIATGTPAGVGMGFNPPKFLKTGDKVICEIDKIGRLENTIGE